jgi:hypothetical protein
VLTGSQVPQLIGVRQDHLEVLAIQGGKCVPIPFQVDKRSPDGSYAMPHGAEPISVSKPATLERNDELVLMMSDMGSKSDRCPRQRLLEIEAVDPLGGPARYAYINATDSPRRSSLKYVYFDPLADRIETDFYRIGLKRGWPTDFALQHQIYSGAPNLIDRFKVRTSARLLKSFTYRMNEDDIRNQLLAWKLGPVRLLRLESHSVNLLLGIRSPSVQSQVFMYRNYLESPTRVSFPWLPRPILDQVRARLDVDYLDLNGFVLTWSGMNLPPVVIGSNSPAEREIESTTDGPNVEWMALRGQDRLLVQTLRPSPDVKLIRRALYYSNSTEPDPPEQYPGQHPGVGYITTGYRNLGGGSHTFDSLFVIAPGTYDAPGLIRELSTPALIHVHDAAPQH